ncbi:SDR family oxidoreductase [Streptomyces sp. NBC_00503]|uniref:SDR family oxidoreductase n=1 Tax=Streptomyces sp. NBC_00503 TaxID=2903659 RepID=UPI002E823E9F|nr:SDR family oxidoreductase [Streptomyces sp. NBC_00503]WUD79140.1 SDR family oxidoreductase [Streptomyces sp. NBC_00503]
MTGPGLAGRVALVTGGAGHIGSAIVETLAERGATVLVNCFHSYAQAKSQVASLCDRGLVAETLHASVAKAEHVERMFAEIRSRHGRLDILVNNAAVGVFGPADELTEEDLDRVLATNIKGALWCSRLARPLMAAAGGGAIVNVSSIGAELALEGYLATGVSKAALEALTRYLAAEYAVDRITVNTVSAGAVESPALGMFPNPEAFRDQTLSGTPLGRLANAQDMAEVVAYLVGDGARFVTGQRILTDGGFTTSHRSGGRVPEPSARRPETPLVPHVEPRSAAQPESRAAALSSFSAEGEADPIAVVGMGLVVPGASSPEAFWEVLLKGGDLLTKPPGQLWPGLPEGGSFTDPDRAAEDKTYQAVCGFITDFEPHHRLRAEREQGRPDDGRVGDWLRHSLHQAMDGVARKPSDRFGLVLGTTPESGQRQEEAVVIEEIRRLLVASETATDRKLAQKLAGLDWSVDGQMTPRQLVGAAAAGILPAEARLRLVDTACSSSLYAIDLGMRELMAGACEIAVCGGAFEATAGNAVLFSKLSGLSPSGVVHALDERADGALFSDGAAVVVLKRLSRATADGDTVHGIVRATGLSADGRGKAIYAASSQAQSRAVRRALTKGALEPQDIGYVVAHATGTPAGDLSELTSLQECYGPVLATSNKSLIGHTGWAAGAVSVINLLLAMRHATVPPQHRHRAVPASVAGSLRVPTEATAWPERSGGPRIGAVSGFGFGGTNAHLVIQEHRSGHPAPAPLASPSMEDLVVVGWAATVPGAADLEDVVRWAREGGPARSWGEGYPRPPVTELRMPGPVVRTMDRTQLALLECFRRLPQPVREACERHRDTTGVIIGHTGHSRGSVHYRMRTYLDAIEHSLKATDRHSTAALKRLRKTVTTLIPAPVAESHPSTMPNIVASRLSNHLDLRGLNIVVDAGEGSLIEAIDTGALYLRGGDLSLALVGAAHGNTLPGWAGVTGGDAVGEGAVLLAVTTESVARAEQLPILAVAEVDQ